jgi:acyl carrier protein
MNSLDTVKSILAKRGVDVSKLKEDDSLQELGLDSLDLVEVMLEIEDALNVEFSSNEIASLNTVKDVAELINSKKA